MNRRQSRYARKTADLVPGTPVYTGDTHDGRVSIKMIDYDSENVNEKNMQNVDECPRFEETGSVTWINVNGLSNPKIISSVGDHIGLHPLTAEDIMNTGQRPKYEPYPKYIFFVMRMLDFSDDEKTVTAEQVSVVTGANYVLSFQEAEGDVFGQVRNRIRLGRGRIRRLGPDYLAYSLLDAVADRVLLVLEELEERVEMVEDRMHAGPSENEMREVHMLLKELAFVRRNVMPLREVITAFKREEQPFVHAETRMFLRDANDHILTALSCIETLHERLGGVMDLYLSMANHRMNDIMRVLTVIATIFMPLAFITGIYGMNFRNMPELSWPWAYPTLLGLMVASILGMILYFKRKKWL